jgi:hypothetical protein
MYANTTELPLDFAAEDEALRLKHLDEIRQFISDVDETHRDSMLAGIPGAVGGTPEEFVESVAGAVLAGATLHDVRRAGLDGAYGDRAPNP